MSRRVIGFFSLVVILLGAIGLMSFTFLGTATGLAGNATSSAYGAKVNIDTAAASSTLLGPLPRVVADKLNLSSEASLVRIADVPPGGALIQEIAALYETANVNLAEGSAHASSDTAHVGLLHQTSAGVTGLPALPGAGVPALPGSSGVVPNVPALPGVGAPAVPVKPAVAAPAVNVTDQNLIDLDAVHGIVDLNCDVLAAHRGDSEVELLNRITEGSTIARLRVKPLNIDLNQLNTVTDPLGPSTDDHAAALHVRVALSDLHLPALPVVGDRIAEVWLYEVQGTNLRSPSLTNATASASVDMIHIKLLDKITGMLEADVKIGHAESSLSSCGKSPTSTPTPTNPTSTATSSKFIVDVNKAVETINGVAQTTQVGLSANPGQEVGYSLSAFNRTVAPDCSITKVVDTLPVNTSLVSEAGDFGTGTYDPSANTVTWDNLSIPNGSAERQGVVIRFADNAPSGTYLNRFTASGSCGSFTAVAPGVSVNNPTQVLGTKFSKTTPRTGIEDTAMWFLGALTLVVGLGGIRVLRRA